MFLFEQQADIKFFCKLGKSATETHVTLIMVYADEALKNCSMYDWYNQF
jgi:hypothetical protein